MVDVTSDAPVTVVMTDLEGSTALHTQLGDTAARTLIRQHEAIVRSALADHGGNEVKTMGDGFLAYFTSTRRALDCAIDIQRRCETADAIRVRIGLHCGEVIHEDDDIFGAAVAAVARIMACAAGGEILVSDLVRQLAGAAGVRFTARRPVQLKGLEGTWLLHDVAWRVDGEDKPPVPAAGTSELIDGLAISPREAEVLGALRERLTNAEIAARLFISVRTVESHVSTLLRKLGAADRRELARRAITSQEVRSAGAGVPVALTSFIGRHDESELVAKRLREGRLVTLKGPGGVGKTRLAIELAKEASGGGDTDVAFADLTAASDESDVLRVLATAVGVTDQPGRTLSDSLLGRLGGAHTLLVLDNCEQILDEVAQLVEWMLAATSDVRVLITSREPLDLPGEVVVSLAPLGVPEGADESAVAIATSDAGRLFVDRASAVDGAFVLTDANAAAVASICRRLDGVPLALELAAGQVDLLDPAQIDALLDQSFAVLRGSGRGRPAHHETLEAMLAASFDGLDAAARATMNRLSVFRGTFTLDAVQAVVADDVITAAAVLDAVRTLVRKSLIVVVEGASERRYRLLETVREYSWRELVADGLGDASRERHFEWAMNLASRAAEGLTGSSQVQWLNALDYDLDNIEAALEWSLDDPGRASRALAAVSALSSYWMARGTHRVAGTRWFETIAIAATNLDQATRAQALLNGIVLMMWSDVRAAMSLLAVAQRLAAGDECAELYATVGAGYVAALRGERIDLAPLEAACDALVDDGIDYVWAVAALAWNLALHGDNTRAHKLMCRVTDRLRELGDEHLRGGFLSFSADLAAASGQVEAAYAEASESLDPAVEMGCASCESQARASLSLLEAAGDGATRVAHARRGVALASQIAETINVLGGLDALIGNLALTGDHETALTLAAAADALRNASGFGPSLPARAELARRGIDLARSAVGEPAFDALWNAGASLGYEHAVELALTGEGIVPSD